MILLYLFFSLVVNLVTSLDSAELVSIKQEYAEYLSKHSKSLDRLLDTRRLERFQHYKQIILDHNAGRLSDSPDKHSFLLKLNPLADMLVDEVDQLFGYRNNKKNSTLNKRHHNHSLRSTKDSQKSKSSESYYHSNLYPFFGRKKHKVPEELKMKSVALPETLNWASEDNPIGSSVMSSVRNQGGCGACWAFVAVATTEAALRIALSESTATNQATHHMQGAADSSQAVHTPGYGMLQSGIDGGMDVSSNRGSDIGGSGNSFMQLSSAQKEPIFDIADDQDMFPVSPFANPPTNSAHNAHLGLDLDLASPRLAWIPSLSVQELVDCDTSFNRGCSGGSPLYAFRFIADNGLLPWSRYEYEEKVDVCGAAQASILPVAKYFIREYGKVAMLDSAALLVALNRGPVALGVCGTDPRFMLYSTGVFDLEACCTEQNHAVTLVGYGHDDATGLDYWLAQNSWGKMWGESGYIKIKRQDILGQAGICGMLANPMFGAGGYVLDEKGHFIDPTTSPHYPRYVTDMQHWVEDNWREMMLITSAALLCTSVLVLLYACYVERMMFLQAQLRAARMGYSTIPDSNL